MVSDCIKSIAIFRLSALGDVTLMIPLVRTLQKSFPQAKIVWITSEQVYGLLEGLSGVEFIVIKKPKSIVDYYQCYQQFKAYQFDVLLAAQASLRANLLYPLISAKTKIGFDKKRSKDCHHWFIDQSIESKEVHLLDGFLQFAEMLGITKSSIEWDLPLSNTDRDWAKSVLSKKSGKWIVINPSASKQERNWPIERLIETINRAAEKWSINIVLTGGNSAKEIAEANIIESAVQVVCLNLVAKTTFKQLAALLEKADLLISPDTGPAHIATAVGTPVIGLYAVVSAKLSGPYLSKSLIIDKYEEAVQTILHKNNQNVSLHTRVHHEDAMKLITVDDVLEKLRKVLESE
ncbi:MAG: glycosyltransferase family 9 protein [Methylococcales bacterium]|jgi:heptosyltransferase I|nr:glycosyltransferase family 9 protein [Methylococcales bacterium]MBT7409907.1 glycosyltransferase family 9 protein [Methylococcales bacterium]